MPWDAEAPGRHGILTKCNVTFNTALPKKGVRRDAECPDQAFSRLSDFSILARAPKCNFHLQKQPSEIPSVTRPARPEQTQPSTAASKHALGRAVSPSDRLTPNTQTHILRKLKTFICHILLPNRVECKTGA